MKINYQGRELEISTKHRKAGKDYIVFIHGWGCSKESFDNAFSSPELKGFSLLSFDLLGCGSSTRPKDFSYAMA
ncbi:MAG: hypothetical protein KGH64_04835 [Candidatus Micrarchaeota archaeon]|nr:hypothetical protein [Candidatus Micrarchaeota archaeon]MDE1859522.1 hypothetical protein [Candidatus Micrarchaeota archaeon]